MELRSHVTTLRLAETFTIARSSVDVEDVLHVELEHDGVVAYGEGAPVDYWGETLDGMRSFVADVAPPLLGDDPFRLEDVLARLAAEPGPRGAKMALDGALHDWVGKRTGLPVYRLLGLAPRIPETSYTIGIDDLEGTADRVRRAERFRRLKVKVGGPGDIERLRIVRELTDVPIRIDGNEGWTLELARELTPELRALGVEFVEQPFPAADLDSFHRYREVADRLPVIVDEGCGDAASVPAIAGYADGINIKLSKCGGIREAVRMVHVARALGLQVMLGCMIESELGIAQAAAMAPLVDHVDLDGHLLIADAPFTGLGFEAGRVTLAEAPGLGVEPASPGRDLPTAFDPPQ